VAIGDVTGHDRHAAAAMAQVRNVLRGVAHSLPESPAGVLTALDRAMGNLEVDALATAVLVRVEQCARDSGPGQCVLRWSNAGHPAPLLLGADRSVTSLDREPDLLLGVAPDRPRTEHAVVLPAGATIVLYTDGLIERRGEDIDTGLSRLAAQLTRHRGADPETLADALLDLLPADGATDDTALVALRL